MKIRYEQFTEKYGKDVIDIFNYYIENSFAAFPEQALPHVAFPVMQSLAKDYPAFILLDDDAGSKCVGFGFLKSYNPMPAFRFTAACTYFLHHTYTGKNLGSSVLARLESEALTKGIRTLLAEISSENPGSIEFHKQNGFTECGRFKGIGVKMNKTFDVIWMQKELQV